MSHNLPLAGEVRAALVSAIRNKQFSVRYQPILDLTTRRVVGAEALVRWEHPSWGMLSPSDFIPIAERSGLIAPIDLWVLRTACEQVKAWQAEFSRALPLAVSVNLSAKLISQKGVVERIRRILDATGLDPAYLRLEITETVLMKESVAHIRTLQALRQLGVRIAIDDFGVGYSSLNYLRWLPADVLKLDRSFIRRLGEDDRSDVIVQGIVSIAQGLGMTVTAEGIETELQCDVITRLGCNYGQGYYFAQPLRADDLTALLELEDLGHAIGPGSLLPTGSGDSSTTTAAARVLVIDDDPNLRQLASTVLEMGGFDVVAAADGKAALEMLRQRPPGVILLDMMMPVMDGRSFSQAYHEWPGTHAPIVVLSAAPDAHARAREIGAATYLRKPFDVEELLTSVHRLTGSGIA